MEFRVALVLVSILVSPSMSQSCSRITEEVLGDTSAPSEDGLIASILAVQSMPADPDLRIQLLQYNLVCEASAGRRDQFRFVSLVAEYLRNGSTFQSQFEFSCQTVGDVDVWGIEVSGSTEDTVTTPPDAALNTTLRRDCHQCLSPRRSGSSANNSEHCLECDSNCFGQLMCSTAFTCCNFLAPSGDCRATCPSNSSSTDSFECECLPGFTGGDCSTDIDECAPNPCRNSGNCTDDINSFSCECDLGYTGMTCSEPIGDCGGDDDCENGPIGDCGGDDDCENGGTCLRNTSGFFTCQCSSGFSGSLCQDVVTSARCGESCFIAIIVVVVVLVVLITITTIIVSVVVVVKQGKKKGSHKVTRRRKKQNQKEARTAPSSTKKHVKEAFLEDPVPPAFTQTFGGHVASDPEHVADHVIMTSSSDQNPEPHFESGDVITELPITTSTFGQHVKSVPVSVEAEPTTPTRDNISMEMSGL